MIDTAPRVMSPGDTTSDRASGQLMIYNTHARTKEAFQTIEPGRVRMYVCGVTVYDSAHIGHGMSAIVFDVIRRYLEYRGLTVLHAQNFTDIDDKIIARANRDGIPVPELTDSLIREWLTETLALNVLPATIYPRATEELPAIIAMIQGLIEKDHAYEAGGDVFFRVRSFGDYGQLSHRALDDLISGARIDVDERKNDPLDFVLWKAVKPGEPSWSSPFGDGRPGWHIECSAMCSNHLGGVVDIHGGGRDLIFPHHENEIAQSEAFLGQQPFARYWLHNGMLQLNGEKMSKSLGNIVWIRDILGRGLGAAFRILVLQTHYRSPLNFSHGGLEAAERGLERLRLAARDLGEDSPRGTDGDGALTALTNQIHDRFVIAMNDDFDTPIALATLFDLGRAINRVGAAAPSDPALLPARAALREYAYILGIDLSERASATIDSAAPFVDLLVEVREALRAAKQWELSDRIRNELAERGITIEDGTTGTTWRVERQTRTRA
jgi:cysteinyl-tRNA synthetase